MTVTPSSAKTINKMGRIHLCNRACIEKSTLKVCSTKRKRDEWWLHRFDRQSYMNSFLYLIETRDGDMKIDEPNGTKKSVRGNKM